MKKITTLLFFIFFIKISSISQITVSGSVYATQTREVLVGAIVTIGTKSAVTDVNGIYALRMDSAGLYKATVTFVGFQTWQQDVDIPKGNITDLNFALEVSNTVLQTTTVTAGKFQKPLSEVTVSLDVIKPQLLENVNARQVDAVLQKVPGVNIIDGQANIRGGSGWSYGAGSRVLLLVDDIPALQADAGFPNWRDLPVENVEQIEVVKGAASALYGSAAMNGIINIRTGFAKSEPETHLTTHYLAYLTPKNKNQKWWTKQPYESTLNVTHKQKFGNFDFAGSAMYFNQSSFRESSYDKFGRITFNTRYRLSDKLSIGVNANFNKGASANYLYWKNNLDGVYQNGSGNINSSQKLRFNIDPYLTYFDNNGNRHKVLMRYYNVDNEVTNNQSNHSQLFYGEYQFQKTFSKALVMTAGLVTGGTNVTANLYGGNTLTSWNLAGYVQADAKLGNRLNLSGGLRYERNTINGPDSTTYFKDANRTLKESVPKDELAEAKPVFRLGANYKAFEATYIRASWGQGYRFPTIAELFINTTAGALRIVPNPTLTSETGWTTELGIKQGFKLSGFQGYVDVVAFWSEYQNMMEFVSSPKLARLFQFGFESRNVGNTVIKGYEVSVAGTGKIGEVTPSVLIGYTYIDPKFKNFTEQDSLTSSAGYNVLKYRFRHNVKFDAELTFGRFSIGSAILHNSHQENIDFVLETFLPGVRDFRKANNKGFTTIDVRASFKPFSGFKITLIGANLGNELYTYRPGYAEPPRNVSARLDYVF